MRAIMLATDSILGVENSNGKTPSALLPLVDRPFVQHVVEYLIDSGFREIDIIYEESGYPLRDLLGEGTKWGCCIRYHLTKSNSADSLSSLINELSAKERILVASADVLPIVDLKAIQSRCGSRESLVLRYEAFSEAHASKDPGWLGWGWYPVEVIRQMFARRIALSAASFSTNVGRPYPMVVSDEEILSARTFQNLMDSNRRLLNSEAPKLYLSGLNREQGVRCGRNVKIHPTVKIEAPVYIGRNCRIGAGTLLRQGTIIGNDCIVGTNTVIRNAIIMADTYIGDSLDLIDAIADGNRLTCMKNGKRITVQDRFVISEMPSHSAHL